MVLPKVECMDGNRFKDTISAYRTKGKGITMRRTTATTEYLKECMGTALLELMKEKPIEKISIEEMTAKADVGRSTYFRYFKSKDEVLAFKIVCLWKRYAEESRIGDFLCDLPVAARIFFEFCLSIRELSELLYAIGRKNVILDAYLQIMGPRGNEENVREYYHSYTTAYAVFGLVDAWILRGYRETPGELEQLIRDNQHDI